ncbi:hypothetical protein SELMODRAFT_108049 [Selaginella moellendorffii]|uniref:Armadillo repeat-containing domain-containing protein n=1 Tax=Selaginella moellendorffii TaxID=88036 RepID=D8S4G0_SELML|nr:hypothetical protein SELMODRAFT_108049 [Selaginella moellendorffii]
MFTDAQRQKQRQGRYGTPRRQYLQDLVTRFQGGKGKSSKEQIVAHLANFAYDPFNYDYFRELNIVELFLDCLTEPNERLVEFALGGICNCCPDSQIASMIIACEGIPLIVACLSSHVENTVLSAIVSLYYLCTPSTEKEILTPPVIEIMKAYAALECVNVRFRNAAQAFLDRHIQGKSPEQ